MEHRYSAAASLFVLGNGASLRGFDFARLSSVATIGMNAAYRYWQEIDWYPTYYCCMDTVVTLSHADAIRRLIRQRERNGIQRFFLRTTILEAWPELAGHEAVFFLETERDHDPLLQARRITTGAQSALWGAYLGYRHIFLLGIDLNYVERVDGAATVHGNVLEMADMPDENPNYFFDSYQQVGDRFHIPNPDPDSPVHVNSWREAAALLDAHGVTVVNCNLESHLRLFPFQSTGDVLQTLHREADLPRLLLLDFTKIGSNSATGMLKQRLLREYPPEALMQVYTDGHQTGLYQPGQSSMMRRRRTGTQAAVIQAVQDFQPDVIYYRPVADKPAFHRLALHILETVRVPYVIHIMDDWIERLAINDPTRHARLDTDLRRLLDGSAANLSISEAMSRAYQQRYGGSFVPVANCLDLPAAYCPRPVQQRQTDSTLFRLRYTGGLADDMGRESLLKVARLVSRLHHDEGLAIVFEMYLSAYWQQYVPPDVRKLPGVVVRDWVPLAAYPRVLAEADALLIAYNFDAASIRYTRYSMANKLPDYLAAQRPIIAYGPADIATIARMQQQQLGEVITTPENLEARLRDFVSDTERHERLAARGLAFAREHLHASQIRGRFYAVLKDAARSPVSAAPAISAKADGAALPGWSLFHLFVNGLIKGEPVHFLRQRLKNLLDYYIGYPAIAAVFIAGCFVLYLVLSVPYRGVFFLMGIAGLMALLGNSVIRLHRRLEDNQRVTNSHSSSLRGLRRQHDRAGERLNTVQERLNTVQAANDDLQSRFDSLSQRHERLQASYDEAIDTAAQTGNSDRPDRIKQLEDTIATLQQQLSQTRQQVTADQDDRESLQRTIQRLRAQLADRERLRQNEIDEALQHQTRLEATVQSLQEANDTLTTQIADLTEDNRQLQARLDNALTGNEALQARLEQSQRRLEILETDLDTAQADRSHLEASLAAAREQITMLDAERDTLHAEKADLEADLNALQSRINEVTRLHQAADEARQSTQATLEATRADLNTVQATLETTRDHLTAAQQEAAAQNEQRQLNQAFLEQMLTTRVHPVHVVAPDGTVQYSTGAAAKGQSVYEVLPSHGDLRRCVQRALAGEAAYQDEIIGLHGNLRVRTHRIAAAGAIDGVLVEVIPAVPSAYPYHNSPPERPRSTVSLMTLLSHLNGQPLPTPAHPDIHPVLHKCRHHPDYVSETYRYSGVTEPDAAEMLYLLVRWLQPDAIIEVGTYNGASTITMAQALVDSGHGGCVHGIEISDAHYRLTQTSIAEAGLSEYVRLYHGASTDAAIVNRLPESQVIFIDGGHTYDGARADFEVYSRLLAAGGVLIYHDTVKITGLQRLMREIADRPAYEVFTMATSDGDGLSLIWQADTS